MIGTTTTGDLTLPDDAVTQGFAIVARRRSGKSNLAGVIEETFCDRGDPWVALDPVGAHWGIRYLDAKGQPGKPSGYDVMIVGGKYGDVPLEEKQGAALAQIIVETDISCVIDLSAESMAAQQKFTADFANELLRLNETPRHVIIEEAQEFVPQQLIWDNQKYVRGALTKMVKGGGGKGIGYTLITQRPASVAKDVLEQIDNLFVLRMSGPNDLKAVQAWFEHNVGDKAQMAHILSTLPAFKPGEAWLLSPDWMHEVERMQIRERRTYHAGRTPKRGEALVTPKRVELGEVIGKYRDAATKRQVAIQAERDLKTENVELRRKLAAVEKAAPQLTRAMTKDPNPCGHEKQIAKLRSRLLVEEQQAKTGKRLWQRVQRAQQTIAKALDDVAAPMLTPEQVDKFIEELPTPRHAAPVGDPARGKQGMERRAPAASTNGAMPDARVHNSEQRVIDAAAALHAFGIEEIAGPTLAAHARYRYSGGFRNILSSLRGKGLLQDVRAKTHQLTDAGARMADVEPIRDEGELRDRWLALCSNSARPLLQVLIAEYPEGITGPDLAARCDREYSGGFRNLMSELCTMSAATRPSPGVLRAADELFPEVAR